MANKDEASVRIGFPNFAKKCKDRGYDDTTIANFWDFLKKKFGPNGPSNRDIQLADLKSWGDNIPDGVKNDLLELAGISPQSQQGTSQTEKEKIKKAIEKHILEPFKAREQQQHLFEDLKSHFEQFKQKISKESNTTNNAPDVNSNDLSNLASLFTTTPDPVNLSPPNAPKMAATVNLPYLGITPKDFPDLQTNKFIVRERVLQYFEDFNKFDHGTGSKNYGYYFSGPNGVGKSVAIYFLACLAYAYDWFVIYIPQSDDWVSSENKTDAIKYFLKAVARGLGKYHEEELPSMFPTNWSISTIGELVASGISSVDPSYIESVYLGFLDQLRVWDRCPILLIFDEVNALFSKPNPDRPATNHVPFNFGSTLNLVDMRRGWKLISGTGHEKFLANLQSGIEKCVRRLCPYDMISFNTLIEIASHKWLFDTLKSIGDNNTKEKVDLLIKRNLGGVPRQLSLFGDFLNKEFAKTGGNTNNYFKKQKISGPQEQIRYMLWSFEVQQKEVFLEQATRFLNSNANQKPTLLESLFQLFLGLPFSKLEIPFSMNAPFFSLSYLDLSLIYKDDDLKYKFITPAAEYASVELLQKNYSFDVDKDAQDVTCLTKANDEKARAFERLFAKRLLFKSHQHVEVVNFAGESLGTLDFTCRTTRIIPNEQWGISGELDVPTLLIPASSSFPIADFILFNPEKKLIIIFQLTLQKHTEKSPSQGCYPALYDQLAWKNLCHQKKPDSNNFIEEIFKSLHIGSVQVSPVKEKVNFGGKTVEKTTLKIQQIDQQSASQPSAPQQPFPYQIHWVIVCPRLLPSDNNEYKQTAISYPWAEIVQHESLKTIFGETIINSLQK